MIEAEQLTRTFGRRTVLDGVTFRVAPGEAVLLTGPNGAGKTTLLRILAGYLPASSGQARVAGCDLLDDGEAARAQLGYVSETAAVYPDMRLIEYLRFRGRLRGLRGRGLRRRLDAVLERCDFSGRRQALLGTLSRGERVRVAVADALLHEPSVLLLDDPLAALDVRQRAQLVRLLVSVRDHAAVLVSSHLPGELGPLCARGLTLDAGRLLRDGPLVERVPPATGDAA